MRSENEIRKLLAAARSLVSLPEATMHYSESQSLAARFANNAITQNKSGAGSSLSVTVARDTRRGSSSTNRVDRDGLRDLVARAEAIAASAPEDPEYMPPLEPAEYPPVPPRFFGSTARTRPEDLAAAIGDAVKEARTDGMTAAGTFEVAQAVRAIANSRGLFACQESTSAEFGVTVQTPSGTGKASAFAEDIQRIDTRALAAAAVETARRNSAQAELEPGEYTVILSPHAAADVLAFLFYNLDAREADEGLTPFSGKAGQPLFDSRVNIVSPVDDPEMPPPLFGEDGLPARECAWVREGVLERLHHSRFWAQEKGTRPDPHLMPVRMDGEERDFEDLIGLCDRALLVERLWYIRYVDRKELLLTGMTRDGLFLVENGEVTRAVRNFRFNESPLVVLENIKAMSRPERVRSWCRVPGMLVEGFTFSSTTDF